VLAVASEITLRGGNTILRNARAGISVFGSGDSGTPNGARINLYETKFYCNSFDIDYESVLPGGIVCASGPALSDNAATGNILCAPSHHCSLTDTQVATATWVDFLGSASRLDLRDGDADAGAVAGDGQAERVAGGATGEDAEQDADQGAHGASAKGRRMVPVSGHRVQVGVASWVAMGVQRRHVPRSAGDRCPVRRSRRLAAWRVAATPGSVPQQPKPQ